MTLAQLGRYKITGTLGRGAMGTVYSAHDPLIERTVAIKTVSCTGLSRDEADAFEQRFYREAKSAGRLNHPNIVTIHDVGRSDDLAYIAMEFLTGRSLREILDSGVVLPLERIAEIAARIADGLAFAHANDVVHRDIKPANIMVLDNDTVKIADFGVALLPSGSQTMAGTAFGSPKYMSPEQVTGQKADGRSDIFSLGAVLYEMLTGHPPFTGADLHAILYQVLNGAPPLPSSFNPSLPRGFDRIVARAMAKDPDKRYQNAAEMAAHLRKYRYIVKQAQKKQNAGNPPPASEKQATTAAGDDTVQLKAIGAPTNTAPGKSAYVLRYGAPLAALALLAGWFLLRPAATQPPPGITGAETAHGTPPATALATPTPTPAQDAESNAKVSALPRAPEAAAVTAAPPAVTSGRIRLAIAPWGEVYVDGKKAGISPPLTEIRLPAGKHSIEIRNSNFKAHRQSVDVAPDTNLRIKHKFE
jgi:serine/threonine-protein kinase